VALCLLGLNSSHLQWPLIITNDAMFQLMQTVELHAYILNFCGYLIMLVPLADA
jgi:hypothetical protein